MTTLRSEAEIVTFRKLAQELAHGRKERATSVHLLAALAARPGAARELLRERRLDDEALLKAGRSFDETAPDAIARAITSARELAKRSTGAAPGGLHVLLALLADRRSAAHRALEIAGVDLARLRGAAMQQAIGAIATRRVPPLAPPERAPGSAPGERGTPAAPARAAARQLAAATPVVGNGRSAPAPAPAHAPPVAVPLFPQPPRRPRDEGRATPVPIAPAPRARAAPPAEPVALPKLAADAAAAAHASVTAPRRANGRRGGHELSFQGDELALDRGRCPVLCSLGRNLTAAAAAGELDEVVARDAEIEHVLDVLAKRTAPSACLVGPAGVGKTAVARGVAAALLAHAEATGTRPRLLVELVSSELIAGTGARGALAERLAAIRAEVRGEGGRVVLFVDDVHELVGGGAPDEATAELKLGLARGELTLLGATTLEEYKKAIESDPVLARRFTVVEIEEPSEEVAFAILRRVADGLAAHHGLGYPDDAVTAAIAWSARYLPGRALPDKAGAILDLAGARARRRPPREEPSARRPARRASERTLGLPDVAAVVAELADIPSERLLETDAARMLGLEALLAERVVGHDWALSRIATVLRRNAAGLRGRRPIGTFLLLGPTGVGKTETAKAIAAALFHSPDAMTRLDLSEYAEPHAIARLVGAPPGYVGHESGGQLTEAVRRRPYQVVLLDEIEKAHRDVLEAFLQVFDEGRLTDGRGRRVDFTNTVLVLTSNLGAREAGAAETARAVGFARAPVAASGERGRDAMLAAARGELPPELWNRLDEVLCYAPLTRDEVAEIARRLLDDLATTLEQKGVGLQVEDGAVTALLDGGGFDPSLGARPMRRAIMRSVEAPLAEMLLRGELPPGSVAVLGVDPRSRRLSVTVGSGSDGGALHGLHGIDNAEGRAASA